MMRSAYRQTRNRIVWPALLILFAILGQNIYWAGGSKWLAHALEHDKASSWTFAELQHHGLREETVPASETTGDAEHNSLHAMEHGQLVPLSVAVRRVPLAAAPIAEAICDCLVRRGPERQFRPPREFL